MTDKPSPEAKEVLAAFIEASLLEKMVTELWATASPGMRERFADAIIETTIARIRSRTGFSPVDKVLDDELRLIVAGAVEMHRADVVATVVALLKDHYEARIQSITNNYAGDSALFEAMKNLLKNMEESRARKERDEREQESRRLREERERQRPPAGPVYKP